MPLYDQTTLPDQVDKIRTVNNASKNVDTDEILKRKGRGAAAHAGTITEWKTRISWKPVDAETKDGTGVEATVLGPDHLAGDKPEKGVCPNAGKLNRIAGLDGNKGYVKGHLLNEKLGGPGGDDRNLTAIPRTTNTGGMKDNVEERLKALVNGRRAWVYFKAKVWHKTVDEQKKTKTSPRIRRHRHAHKMQFWWHELKDDGAGKPTKVPGTEAEVVLDIPPPARYTKTDYSAPTTTHSFGATLKGHTAKGDSDTHHDTATADLAWNAIILQDWDTAKKRAEMIEIAAAEIQEIGAADAKKMIDLLSTDPEQHETDLLRWIEHEVKRLQANPHARPSRKLTRRLDAYDEARSERVASVAKQVKALLEEKNVPKASKLAQQFKLKLDEQDPLASYRQLIQELLLRNERVEKEKVVAQKRVIGLELRLIAPMSPFSAYSQSEAHGPELTKSEQAKDPAWKKRKNSSEVEPPAKIDMHQRTKRLKSIEEEDLSTKSNEDVMDYEPTHQALRCMWMLHELREGKKLPPELDKLKIVDATAHLMITAYVQQSNPLATSEVVRQWLLGFEQDRPEAFVGVAVFLRKLLPALAKKADKQSF